VVAVAAAATAGLSSTASAAVLSTSITSPTPNQVVDGDYREVIVDSDAPPELPTMRVTGAATTDGSGPNAVVVAVVVPMKLLGTMLPIGGSEPVDVAADGGFAADVPIPPINAQVVAVPADLASTVPLEDAVLDNAGPYRAVPVLGGGAMSGELPGLGSLSLSIRGQQQGFGVIGPAGFASLDGALFTIGALGGVTSGAYGGVSGDVGLSFMGAGGISDQYNDARGGLMVDGVRGYLRDHIPVGSDELPLPTVRRTVEGQTGGQTIVQTQPIYVAVDPTEDPDSGLLAGGYRASGLELERTTTQGHHGRQVSVSDRFRSTDGAAHRIDVLYAEGLNLLPYNGRTPFEGCLPIVPCSDDSEGPLPLAAGPFAVSNPLAGGVSLLAEPEPPTEPSFEPPAFRIPWETGDRWESRSHADALTAPTTATSTIYTRLPSAARLLGALASIDGGPSAATPPITSTYGAITFGTRPDAGLFVSDPLTIGAMLGGVSTQFVARFVRSVPAGGETLITQAYSTGMARSEVEALAAAAERALTPTVIADLPPTPPGRPPVAPPAPPTPPAARKAPRKLTTSSSLERTQKGRYRFRFRFRGRLALPPGVPRSACRAGGTVTVQIKAGRNTISTRRARLSRTCRYTVRVNFRSAKRFGNRKRLTVVITWSGNRMLVAKPAKRFTVRVR
jgi:hypothetical protein